ncbi:MAG: hypothetical protein R2741_14620 [Methanolobus sp.]
MKKVVFLLMLISVAFMPLASADIVDDMDNKVSEYNANVEYVPSYLKTLLGNEVIEIAIVTDEGDELYVKAVTEDGYITEFEEIDDDEDIGASVVLGANEATIRTVIRSSDPLDEFIAAKDNGEIVVETVGLVTTAKYTVANVVMEVSSLFGF